jgi:hypothetical protein
LGAGFDQQDLCGFGPSPGAIGFPSSGVQFAGDVLDRRLLLLRRTRGFIGACGDLFHGPPKLFGCGRSLAQSAR